MDLTYQVGMYDSDGDQTDDGVFLFLDHTVLRFDSLRALSAFADAITYAVVPGIVQESLQELSADDQAAFTAEGQT